MGFKLVVIDVTARRANIETTLVSPLSEVLQEACTKLGRDASSHGLKHNHKSLDLSNPIRLLGISPNAKLELVKLSKSPSVVSVALQLPEPEAQGITNGRMTDKFPSTTSIWQILRKFESGAAGGLGLQKNFTARGIPQTSSGDTGAGRLYYETPVIKYMGRELSSFVDLQKSLGQLGLNGGSALFRVSFQVTQDPLEDAMTNIEAYFKSIEDDGKGGEGAHAAGVATTASAPDASLSAATEIGTESRSPPAPISSPPAELTAKDEASNDDGILASSSITEPSGEQIARPESTTKDEASNDDGILASSSITEPSGEQIARPESTTKDKASNDNEDLASPSITEPSEEQIAPPESTTKDEASIDNEVLASSSITEPSGEQIASPDPVSSGRSVSAGSDSPGSSQRPMSVYKAPSSDTPVAAQQAYREKDYEMTIAQMKLQQSRYQGNAQNQRLASYSEEEKQRKAKVQKLEAAKELKTRIRFPDQTQVDSSFTNLDTAEDLYCFVRSLMNHEKAPFSLNYRSSKGPVDIPKDSTQRLIADLGMTGSQLINVVWQDGASVEARRAPALKPEHAQNAKEIPVQVIQGQDDENDDPSSNKPQGKTTSGTGSGGRKGGTPAWMKKIAGGKKF